MRTLLNFMPVLVSAALVLGSCEPIQKVSDVPEIKFKSFSLFEMDTLGFRIKVGEMVFSFIDGNADFGVDAASNSQDTLNLILTPFKKLNGLYDSINMDTYGRRYTVLNNESLVRVGQNKTIKGEIKLQIYYFVTPPFDTLKYDFYILDRAGNKSNVASTTDIGF
jgi:hypothetical protein